MQPSLSPLSLCLSSLRLTRTETAEEKILFIFSFKYLMRNSRKFQNFSFVSLLTPRSNAELQFQFFGWGCSTGPNGGLGCTAEPSQHFKLILQLPLPLPRGQLASFSPAPPPALYPFPASRTLCAAIMKWQINSLARLSAAPEPQRGVPRASRQRTRASTRMRTSTSTRMRSSTSTSARTSTRTSTRTNEYCVEFSNKCVCLFLHL